MRRDVFQAIADPTRRAIILLLATQAMKPNAIAEHFDSTRQAISKHLQLLSECEIVRTQAQYRKLAPKPWQARTKRMDFRAGGYWLYAMVGPEGEEHWSWADYVRIDRPHGFVGFDGFCDAEGVPNPDLPRNKWEHRFDGSNPDQTLVYIELTFDDLKDLEATLAMGFKEGFTAGLENLDAYLSARV